MGNLGIATDALASDQEAQYKNERHLQVVSDVASIAVASEYVPDYFNELAGDRQIPCGD